MRHSGALVLVGASVASAVLSWGEHRPACPVPVDCEQAAAPDPAADLLRRADAAERMAREALAVVRRLRERTNVVDADRAAALAASGLEPDRFALVGAEMTPLVTTLGSLESKLLATDPRWAGALVYQLAGRGVRPGTAVCAGLSGSFPGLNLAVMAASRALDARLVAVSSVTASSWGANQAGLTWPEMEAAIAAAGVLPVASRAVSLGGTRDAARDLSPEGKALASRLQAAAAQALGAVPLHTTTLDGAIAARLEVYRHALAGRRPAVYVNVGGNHASLGGANAPLRHDGGWLIALPAGAGDRASVTHAFLAEGVPVLSLLSVKTLAKDWGIFPGLE